MDRKWVHIMFATAGIIVAWLLSKTGDWVWSYFGKPNELYIGLGSVVIAAIATYVAWKNEEVFTLANEVTSELRKVTWPDRRETVSSTIVVIATTIISSLLLGFFDAVWAWASGLIFIGK